jgi:hypothetical protein
MKKIDLHGVKHNDVEILVEDFILSTKPTFYIITGNSNTMKKKSIEVLERHGFKWMIMSHNLGEIIVTG